MRRTRTLWSTVAALSSALVLTGSADAQSPGSATQRPSSPTPSGTRSMQSSEHIGQTTEDKAATEADRSLNQRIRQAFNADPALAPSVQKVQLNTNNGVVTLQGAVPTEKIKDDVSATVQQVAGVTKVENQLQMAPN